MSKQFGTRSFFTALTGEYLDDAFHIRRKRHARKTVWLVSPYKHVPQIRVQIRRKAYHVHFKFAEDNVPKNSSFKITSRRELRKLLRCIQTLYELRAGRHLLEK